MCKKEFQVTPITKVYTELPINLYVKREDLLPFSFGGNKVRIAEEGKIVWLVMGMLDQI